MNKKILASLLLTPLVFTLSGCQNEVTKYNPQEVLQKTVTNSISDARNKSSFNISGTVSADVAEKNTTQNMNIKLDGNSFLIRTNDDVKVNFDVNFDFKLQESADKTSNIKGDISSVIANNEILIKVNSLDLGEMSDPSISTMLALFQNKWLKLPTEGVNGSNLALTKMLNPANNDKQIADTLQIIKIKEDQGVVNGNYILATTMDSDGIITMIKDYDTEYKIEVTETEITQLEEILKMINIEAILTISPDFRFQKMEMTITSNQTIKNNKINIDFNYLWKNESIADSDTIAVPTDIVNLEEMMKGLVGGGAKTPAANPVESNLDDMNTLETKTLKPAPIKEPVTE